MLPDKLTFDVNVCKGLVAMVSLNVIGLRYSKLSSWLVLRDSKNQITASVTTP